MMKRIASLLLSFCCFVLLVVAQNNKMEHPAYLGLSEDIRYYTNYSVSFNPKFRVPNWVAWELIPEELVGPAVRLNDFKKAPLVNNSPTHEDYTNSGYQRGHMCPAADNKWDFRAMEESFYMINVCPQTGELNEKKWKTLEERCQAWAVLYGKVFIVCGPIGPARNVHIRENDMLKSGVYIPREFFKAILRERVVNGQIQYEAIGYILSQKGTWRICSVKEIEGRTGLVLFHNLRGEIGKYKANKVKENVNTKVWQNPNL